MSKLKSWLARSIGLQMQSVTEPTAIPPTGSEFAALGIKSQTLNYPFESTRESVDFIKGTVTACLNARAQERGAIKFKVGGGNAQIRSALQRVLDLPNPVQSSFDFWENCSHMHDATGDAVIYFVKDSSTLPAEMWVIPSFYVVAVFDDPADPVPTAYRWADGRVIGQVECLCFIRQNSIKTAPYSGRGFLSEAIETAVLYDAIVRSQMNWFNSGGAPNIALVQPPGSILTPEQILALQVMWNEKYNTAKGTSNIAILPDGVKPENFGPQEMNFNASKEEVRDAIREYLQTPKIILGDTDNVNLNNGQTALAIFDRTVVLRWAQKVASALQAYFQREYGNNITVEVDSDIVSGLTQLQLAQPATTPVPGQEVPTKPLIEA